MTRKLCTIALVLTLLIPEALLAQQKVETAGLDPQSTPVAAGPQSSAQARAPQTVRPQAPARQRSYERETSARRRSGITKKEIAFMAAIAGTSMGIGALAGGAKGLAIGAIVGGWGAYVGHHVWKWMR